jgi:hypothetical protein
MQFIGAYQELFLTIFNNIVGSNIGKNLRKTFKVYKAWINRYSLNRRPNALALLLELIS